MNFVSFLLLALMLGVVAVVQFFVRCIPGWVIPWIAVRLLDSKLLAGPELTPWLFEPIAVEDLPRHHRSFFEEHTAALLQLGFQPLGDFVLRRDPAPSCSRYFLSPCRTILAALSHYLDEKCISCTSITLDGLYLATGNTPIDDPPPIEHGLQFFVLESSEPAEIVDYHRRSARDVASLRGTELAPIEPEDTKTVLNYGRVLSLRSLHQQGALPEIPALLRDKSMAGAAVPLS
jgi:hypothetical protein